MKKSYPYKLRQLLLVSSITSLEVYLTDVIYEVFESIRLNKESPSSFQKLFVEFELDMRTPRENYSKDIRNLTSGGLQIIEKYV